MQSLPESLNLVITWSIRCFLWRPTMYNMLTIFANDDDNEYAPYFFWVGCILGVFMSVFNLSFLAFTAGDFL